MSFSEDDSSMAEPNSAVPRQSTDAVRLVWGIGRVFIWLPFTIRITRKFNIQPAVEAPVLLELILRWTEDVVRSGFSTLVPLTDSGRCRRFLRRYRRYKRNPFRSGSANWFHCPLVAVLLCQLVLQ